MYLHLIHLIAYNPSCQDYNQTRATALTDSKHLKLSEMKHIESEYDKLLNYKIVNISRIVVDCECSNADFDFTKK